MPLDLLNIFQGLFFYLSNRKKINLDDVCTTSLTLLLQPYSVQIKFLDRLKVSASTFSSDTVV